MCYDVSKGLKTTLKNAIHRKEDPRYIAALQRKLDELLKGTKPTYHVSGFAHPKLLVFTNEMPMEPQLFTWGLIPKWVKDEKTAKTFYNQTLNARGETIWEKPSFKNAANKQRCLIYVDGFFEHHHIGGKTYPFYMSMKDESPIVFAGLWEEWTNRETGEIIKTTTIVTTKANKTMEKIHNNPKAEEGRMPVILPKEFQDEWLKENKAHLDTQLLKELLMPFPDDLLNYHTVPRIRGKEAVGNAPEAILPINYKEVDFSF